MSYLIDMKELRSWRPPVFRPFSPTFEGEESIFSPPEFCDRRAFFSSLSSVTFRLHPLPRYVLTSLQTAAVTKREAFMFQSNLLLTPELSPLGLKRFELIFSALPDIDSSAATGRPPQPRSALLNALVLRNLRSIRTLSDLTRDISTYPAIAQVCGFRSSPSKERFSSFVRNTPNHFFQSIRQRLVKELLCLGIVSGDFLSTDSCPIKAPVRNNNLKTSAKDRFDKNKPPKADPEAGVGVYITYGPKKKVEYFWGYRNHIINDATSELPIAEITKPANVAESCLLIPQLQSIDQAFQLCIRAVIGDAAFDTTKIIEFIVQELKAEPIIPENPRGGKNEDIKLSRRGIPICIAGLQMLHRCKYYDKKQNRWRHKFVCPIKGSKKFARKVQSFCPWNHPKFYNNRLGCTRNLRVDVDQSLRDSIDRSSEKFKKLYNLRTSSERIFSRLLTFYMQQPLVKGLNATANVCTIAHITVLVIALAATKSNNRDKIRFIKTFVPAPQRGRVL